MDQVAEIREKVDIVTLLSEYIPLKRAGKNFKTNCPFHTERSPSFVVSSERQIWHCFGCQKGGDVFTFLMEYEHLEFPEALRILAKRAGVTLITSHFETGISSKKENLYKINKITCEFYHYVFTKHAAGEKAREYIKKRGINQGAIDTFQIGFAPGVGNALVKFLQEKKGYSREDLLDAGLATQRGKTIIDFFTNRIMFPLYDHRDNIVGFSGRILVPSDTRSKYINTRDTLVYHKGDLFFGIQVAKQAIKKENQALLVEGEFDVFSCFQEGISQTLAVKGTAFTDNQARLLARFTQKVTVCFDGDDAGQEAIKRSLPILEKRGLTTTVVLVPNGKDPDEAIKQDAFAFKQAVKHDMSAYDYLLERSLATHDVATLEGKREITEDLLPTFALIENEIIKEHFLRKLSVALDTSIESLTREIERRRSKIQPILKQSSPKEKRLREEILEEYLASLIVQSESPKETLDQAMRLLSEVMPKETAYQKILEHLLVHVQTQGQFDSKQFAMSLPQELLTAYNTSFLVPLPKFPTTVDYQEEIEKAAIELKHVYLQSRIKELGKTLKEKEKAGEIESIKQLQEEFTHLVSLLHAKE